MSYIIVCVKQVPDTSEVALDPVTKTIIRTGKNNIVNPYDMYALEAAARIKDAEPETGIAVLSMGPPQAEDALRSCMAVAADSAWLVSDPCFAGSDTYATSYILSCAVRKIEESRGPCLAVFCGKQAVDGDTAQIGPALAERLGLPQVTSVLEAKRSEDGFEVLQEDKADRRLYFVQAPCLLTFTKPSFEPRQASLRRRMASRHSSVEILDINSLPETDRAKVGIGGSPTCVLKTFAPEYRGSCELICSEPAAAAKTFAERLRERNLTDGGMK